MSAPVAVVLKHPELIEGLTLVPCAVGPDGWLYIPHVDGQWVTAAKLQPFSLAIINCWLEAQPAPPHVTDTEMLDFVADDHLDIVSFEMPIALSEDADIGWEVRSHHMGEKQPRVVGTSHHDDLRAAIRNAMQALGYAKGTGSPS